jgi:hypothetical protein
MVMGQMGARSIAEIEPRHIGTRGSSGDLEAMDQGYEHGVDSHGIAVRQ